MIHQSDCHTSHTQCEIRPAVSEESFQLLEGREIVDDGIRMRLG